MEITTQAAEPADGPDPADAGAPDLRSVQHEGELHDLADERERRQPVREAGLLGERQLREEREPAARLRHEHDVPGGHHGWHPREEQAGCHRQRAGRERAAAHQSDEREDQARLRHHADPARRVHLRSLGQRRQQRRSIRTSTTATGGEPTYAGQAGFASGYYDVDQRHTSHSFVLRTDRKKDWDVELIGSTYKFDHDRQRSPLTASATGMSYRPERPGRRVRRHRLADARPQGHVEAGRADLGAHAELRRCTTSTTSWRTRRTTRRTGRTTTCGRASSRRATARPGRRRCGRRTRGTSPRTSSSRSADATRTGGASTG